MGVTIESKNFSIDLGYGGFLRLRTKVAELTAPDIFEYYKHLTDGMFKMGEDREAFFEKYNKKTAELEEKYNDEKSDIFDFLHESDCGGKIDLQHCKSIYKVIKDYDDNICYGYPGRKNCAMFKDFKNVVKDGINTEEGFEWW